METPQMQYTKQQQTQSQQIQQQQTQSQQIQSQQSQSRTQYQSKYLLDAMYLFTVELKNKSWKRTAIYQLSPIVLVLGPDRTRRYLLPLLLSTFLQYGLYLRLVLLKALPTLLPYLGNESGKLAVLEMLMDILCVFEEEEIRKEGFRSVEKVVGAMELGKVEKVLVEGLYGLAKDKTVIVREVFVKILAMVFGRVNEEQRTILASVLKGYEQDEEGRMLLSKYLPTLLSYFPTDYTIRLLYLMQSATTVGTRCNAVKPIIQLAKHSKQNEAKECLHRMVSDPAPEVFCAVLSNLPALLELFYKYTLRPLLLRVDNFVNEDVLVKNCVMEVLEYIPITEYERIGLVLSTPRTSLNLNRNVASALCRVNDMETLGKMFGEADNYFKLKLFVKLPPMTSKESVSMDRTIPPSCSFHKSLLESILSHKNWRGKLNILYNIQKRVEADYTVYPLLSILYSLLSDRIAIVRVTAAKTIVSIVLRLGQGLNRIREMLVKSTDSKNWFERQAMLAVVKGVVEKRGLGEEYLTLVEGLVEAAKKDGVENVRVVAEEIERRFKRGNGALGSA